MGEAQSCPGGAFRHPKIRQTNFGGGWELNHLRDLKNFQTSAKLRLSLRLEVWVSSVAQRIRSGDAIFGGRSGPKIRKKKNRRRRKSCVVGGVERWRAPGRVRGRVGPEDSSYLLSDEPA